MEEKYITIISDEEEVLAEVLFTHESKLTNKEYVVFQVVDSDEVSAAVYVQTDSEGGHFEDIETEEEWDELEELLDKYYDSLEADEEDDEK